MSFLTESQIARQLAGCRPYILSRNVWRPENLGQSTSVRRLYGVGLGIGCVGREELLQAIAIGRGLFVGPGRKRQS
jgi:hypothetical protein